MNRSHIDSLMDEYRRGGPMVEECPELLSATAGSDLITDDNMGTEWRYYLHLE
jgi:spermidine synthase